jgi:hypothetical protein
LVMAITDCALLTGADERYVPSNATTTSDSLRVTRCNDADFMVPPWAFELSARVVRAVIRQYMCHDTENSLTLPTNIAAHHAREAAPQ